MNPGSDYYKDGTLLCLSIYFPFFKIFVILLLIIIIVKLQVKKALIYNIQEEHYIIIID